MKFDNPAHAKICNRDATCSDTCVENWRLEFDRVRSSWPMFPEEPTNFGETLGGIL